MSKSKRTDGTWHRRWLNRLSRWYATRKSKREENPELREWVGVPLGSLGWRELTEEETKYTKYGWEFLRRNEEYKTEWKQLIADVKSKYGEWEADNLGRQDPLAGAIADSRRPEERAFCKRWGIAIALCPDKSYEDYIARYYEGLEAFQPYFLFRCLILQVDMPVRHQIRFGEDLKQFMENGIFTVEVDINYPKMRLKEQFSVMVDNFKRVYERNIFNNMMFEYCDERNLVATPIINKTLIIDHDELAKDEWREFRELYNQELKKRKAKCGRGTSLYWDNLDTYLKV